MIFHTMTGSCSSFVVQFITWAGNTVWNLLEIIFDVVAPGLLGYVKKAAGAFRTILKDPIGFVGNLVRAGILGFKQFALNIGTHLKTSIIQWLTGSLAGANIYIPQAFELKEIIKFVLSVLGLTWQNIRQKLVKVIGETAVKVLETGFDIVVTLVTEGPAAAWEKIKEQLTNLKEIILEEILSFVAVKIVQSAVTKLISSLNPAGAVIQAIIAIYNTIMFFVERLRQIIQVAAAFIDSLAAIASGVIASAANRVEQTLAGLLTLAISFLARIVGLGRVSDAVINIINKIRTPIDNALDKVVDWIVTMAKKLGKLAVGAVKGLLNWAGVKSGFKDDAGESHTVQVRTDGKPALIITSTPVAAGEFVKVYVARKSAKNPNFKKDNDALISKIEAAVAVAQKMVDDIAAVEKANANDPKLEGMQRALLAKNVELSGLLSDLVGKDESIGAMKEKYLLEGLTGTYGSMPKPRGDDFTADHQPQAAILQAAASFDYFSEEGELAARAERRAHAGFAINLHKLRHEAGRTYGHKGKRTKEEFLGEIKKATKSVRGAAQKRRIVVETIKSDMIKDVEAMRTVANHDAKTAVWSDIVGTKKTKEKEQLVGEVRVRILAGESQIASQDIDSLVG
ncbi:MAG: hypothetical protein HY646_11060 [Acidobacteria bacterium]|nr:hypothetical protein [Acidobacteriota bacterium]